MRRTSIERYATMHRFFNLSDKPDIYLACGTADFLYQSNLAFVPLLRESGWNVKDVWKEGATHEWGFWDEQVKLFLEWALA